MGSRGHILSPPLRGGVFSMRIQPPTTDQNVSGMDDGVIGQGFDVEPGRQQCYRRALGK